VTRSTGSGDRPNARTPPDRGRSAAPIDATTELLGRSATLVGGIELRCGGRGCDAVLVRRAGAGVNLEKRPVDLDEVVDPVADTSAQQRLEVSPPGTGEVPATDAVLMM
jgi:hypothetical protein